MRFKYLLSRVMSPAEAWRTARWRVLLVYRRIALRVAPFYRAQLRRVVFIGVTGSCGKSTTKELIAAVLSSQLKGYQSPGNFNTLDHFATTILRLKPNDEFCVLEIAAAVRGERMSLERPLALVKPQHRRGHPRSGQITSVRSAVSKPLRPRRASSSLHLPSAASPY